MSLSSKTKRTLLAGSALIVGALVIALLIWTIYLDRIITAQFEGRRWTLPAQVYAEPLELYAGQSFGADTLEQELKRLGYRRADKAEQPGSYSRRGTRVELVNRRFQFWDALQEPQLVSVITRGNSIESMSNGRGEDVPIFRLDPLLIGSIFPIHGEDRVVVTPEQVSPLLPAALKVVEDRKFDSHNGVDFGAIARAAWVNLRAGQIEQGGSTLTQQLVKSYFLDNRRTLGRKLEEAMMAWLLEVHFEKQDLMNAYINEIYLGQDGNRAVHGFGLASQFYFGKPLAELQLHEVALLVAIVRGPSYYDPRRHAERVRARRDLVLKLMAQYKVVDEAAAREAAKRPLGIVNASTQAGGYYPAFLDLVRRTLRRDYRDEDLTEAGLKIFSTLSPLTQSLAEKALAQELERLDKARKQKKAQGLEGVVVVTAPQNGEVIAMVGGRQAGFDGFNRALDARRSIGSLVKPVIYLAAVESGGFNAASIVEDGPVEVKLSNNKVWQPQNISEEFYGPVPLVRALAQSMNLATVRLGLDVGLPKVTREFVALGPGARTAAAAVGAARLARRFAAGSRAALQRIRERRFQHATACRARSRRRRGQAAQVIRAGSHAGGRPGRGLPGEPHARAGDGARLRTGRARADSAGDRRGGQDRHFLRLSRQLVRGLLRQHARGRVDRLRRQLADRPDGLVGLAAGLVATDALDRNNVVEHAVA